MAFSNTKTKYAVVNIADNSTTIGSGSARLYGLYVNTALSAHACPIEDNATAIITLTASLSAGTLLEFPGVLFETGLVVNPDDAATGNITVFYTEE